ncbi:MAG: hypothetical protein R2794_03120 [Chitinophagales bacterium]
MQWNTKIRSMALVGFLLFPVCMQAQTQNLYLYIDSNTIIGNIENNKAYVSETEIAYTISGNQIFSGDGTKREQLLFLINAKDILSKKVGLVYQMDGKTIQYITRKNTFYLGDYPIDYDLEDLLMLSPVNDSITEVISGIDGKKLGVISGKFHGQAEIVLAAHMYIRHFGLDEEVQSAMQQAYGDTGASGYGYIRPFIDHGRYYEWEWDGETLKPVWGYRPEDNWKFDGKYLQPVWSADPQSEWVWDGNILRPFWDESSRNQWTWDSEVLKPFWDSDPDKMWKLDDGIMRPMWNFDQNQQWVIEGEIPLPVIALVVLGIADR